MAKTYLDHTWSVGQVTPALSETRLVPTIFTLECSGGTGWAWESCLTDNSAGNSSIGATVLEAGEANGAAVDGLQGRLNFNWSTVSQGHIITLVNATPLKTMATAGNRPLADANDTYIGLDGSAGGQATTAAQLAFGSPIAISNYIGSLPDNTSWLERLTASLKSFKIPITTNSQITSTLANGTAPLVVTSQTRVSNLKTGGNPILMNCGTTIACSVTTLLNSMVVTGSFPLTAGAASITGLPFTNTNFICLTNDATTAANGSNMNQTGNTTATASGTGTDRLSFGCFGN